MTALLFPGQGTQRVGMGAILFRRFAETQALLSEASLAAGIDIGALLRRGPAKVLSRTIYAQVAVTTVNVAVKWSGCHHGGLAVPCTAGTDRLGPPAEIRTMIRIDIVIAAMASHARSRAVLALRSVI